MNLVANILIAAVVAVAVPAIPAMAQEAHTVHFAPGTSGATIKATLKGNDYIDYRLSASAGQVMDVIVSPATVYFNVLAPHSTGEAIFIGSQQGAEFSGTLSVGGTYTVRIYQMGNAADSGKASKFTLDIGIAGDVAATSSGGGGEGDDDQTCLDAVAAETGNTVVLLNSEFSQAATEVTVGVSPQQAPWRCLVSGGVVTEVMSLTDEGRM